MPLSFGATGLCHQCHGTAKRGGRPCRTCGGVGYLGDPPSTANANSQEAAASIKSHAAQQRSVVLAAIRAHGPVSDQRLEAITGLSGNSIRPRRGELETAGLIEHAGKGTTTSGRTCDLWRATAPDDVKDCAA
jgi:hypothetical protein